MPESKLKAAIWDMDGVIADTAPYHFQAWQDVFREKGVDFTEERFWHYFGQRNDTIIKNILGGSISVDEAKAIANEKEANYRQRVVQNITPLPGAMELIRSLSKEKVKMAIASSAPMENIKLVLDGLGITECFEVIVCGKEVIEGKPSPQIFLLAAKKLGVAPQNCIVFEDAVAGVAAAKKAGMKCLAVTNSHSAASLKEADLIVATLTTVKVRDLEALFAVSERD